MKSVFEAQKRTAVAEYKAALHSGDVDEKLVSLLSKLNSLADYYTTSSCAGRVALLEDSGSKRDARFLGKWHGVPPAVDVCAALKPSSGVTYLRLEPAIIHACAVDVATADRLLKASIAAGFKRSGIQSVKDERVMLEILGTGRIDVPVAEDDRVLVDEAYVSFILSIAGEKYAANTAKIKKLEEAVSGF